jgi:hypothetical protein
MAENKNWIEIFLMPLVIAGVGILGTYLITQQQELNAIAKADSDRQIKILEIFAEKITNDDIKQRLLAIKLLRALDDDLAEKLASAVAEAEPDKSKIKKVATKVADVAKARIELRPRIYMHVQSNNEKEAAQAVEQLLERNDWTVPGIQRVGIKTPDSSQLRYFRKVEKSTAEKIRDILKNENYDISLTYIPGYEDSKSIRPMHFEIWFSPGRPKVSS